MNYSQQYKLSGSGYTKTYETQQQQSSQTQQIQSVTYQQQTISQPSANWASTQLLGRVDDKDFLVVQKSKTYEKTEAERQHHYEELIQDNLRMREVIEQLKREVAQYKGSASTDVTMLRKELQITQQELEETQRELMLMKSQSEQKSRAEIDALLVEIEQWRRKCSEFELREKDNAEQLKQLAYYQNKLKLNELEAKKKFEKYKVVDQLQLQLEDQEQLIEELRREIEMWQKKYDSLDQQSQEFKMSANKNSRVSELEGNLEALMHEVEVWKKRCLSLEAKHESSEERKLLARIEQLNRMLGEKDQEMQRTRMTMSQSLSQAQQAQQQQSKLMASQQISDYENQLDQLRKQLEAAQQKVAQYDKEMEGYRLTANVYNADKFDELEQEKWQLETTIDELEKDCDTFMLRIKELESSYSEILAKFNEQNAEYLRYKSVVDSNSSKYKTTENLTKEIQGLQQELEVWKNRYFQTEIRLKEYDSLRIDYDALLLKQNTNRSTTTITNINIENDQQFISIKRERDTYQRQITELEMKIRELQMNSSNNFNIRNSQDDQIRRERDTYQRQVTELEMKIRELQMNSNNTNNFNIRNSQDDQIRRERDQYQKQVTELEMKIRELQMNTNNNFSMKTSQDDQIKRERDQYQKQVTELEMKIRELQMNSNKNSQEEQLRRERDTYKSKVQELEQKITEIQSQVTIQSQQTSVKYVYDETKTKELESKISEYKQKISTYESRISQYELRIKEYETKQTVNQVRNTQSLVEKTVVLTDEPKIKELTEIIYNKNQKISELEQQITSLSFNKTTTNNTSSNTVLVVREQVREKEIRIRELEIQVEQLLLEVERLQNIKRDQESRINIMIQKITEQESQLNILQEIKTRQSKRSPSQQQQIITTTTSVQQPEIKQTTSYISSNTQKIYTSNQQLSPTPALVSQNFYTQPIKNSTTTTTRQVQIINESSPKNIYPQEENINSQIMGRINQSKVMAEYSSQTYQAPQIIVSQYKPIN